MCLNLNAFWIAEQHINTFHIEHTYTYGQLHVNVCKCEVSLE